MKLLTKLKSLLSEVSTGFNEGLQKVKEDKWLSMITHNANECGIPIKYMHIPNTTARLLVESLSATENNVDVSVEIMLGQTTLRNIVCIAHELGHASQFYGECGGDYVEWWVYLDINDTLLIESDAWMRSVTILTDIDFTEWGHFTDYALRAYGSYVMNRNKQTAVCEQILQKFLEELQYEIQRVTKKARVIYA